MRVVVLVAIAVVAVLTPVACSSSSYETPSTECSNGPRWPRGTNFEYERGGPTDAPNCTPHCGEISAPSGMWSGAGGRGATTSDSLPSGSCNEDGVVCTMSAEWLGPCPAGETAVGPLDLFICRCANDAWVCTVDATSPSATGFSCSGDAARRVAEDAGADASGD